jgi:hypothetical protein
MPGQLDGKRILILATHGFEQSELEVPRDRLKAAGAQVDVVSPEKGEIKGWDMKDWGRPVKVDKALTDARERLVSNQEMRALLLNVEDEFRTRILWQIERWSTEKDDDASRERWAAQLPEFLRIWPRQISAKSPNSSARLCELAFSSGDRFPVIAELVLPLLSQIDRDHLSLPGLRRSGNSVVDRHPSQALALLHAVLPDNALAWPHGIDAVLQRIGAADPSLNTDERLIALKRRWDAR